MTHDVVLAGTVRDVLVRRPKVSPATSTVGHVRELLADDHVHMVLLADADGRLAGTVVRDDLASAIPDDAPALSLARLDGRTVPADLAAAEALRSLAAAGVRRAAVVEDDGRLVGLLCLKRSGTGFCGDRDVAARRAARMTNAHEVGTKVPDPHGACAPTMRSNEVGTTR